MDAGTSTPNPKPRLSRRLLSHFTLTLSVLLALSFVTLAVVGPTTQEAEATATNWLDQVDWLDIWTYSFADELYDYLLSTKDNGVLSGDPKNFALTLATGFRNTFTLTENQVKDFKNQQDLLSYYYIRKAEWAARQLWLEQNSTTKNFVFDPLYVLKASEIGPDMYQFGNFAVAQFNNIIDSYDGVGSNFSGYYSGVGIGLLGETDSQYNKLDTIATAATPNIDVQFMVKASTNLGTYYYDGASPLYCVKSATSSLNVKIYDAGEIVFSTTVPKASDLDLARIFTISNVTLNLTAGVYQFDEGFMGNLIPLNGASVTDHTQLGDAACVRYDSPTSTTMGLFNKFNTARNTYSDNIRICAFSSASDKDNASHCYYVKPYVKATIDLFGKLSSSSQNALQFAQSYYNAIVVSGDPGGAWDLPLMLMPDPSQMEGMDWQQLYAIYLAYIQQAYDWYQLHSGALEASRVNISGESLNLKVRGSITNQTGVTLFDNTTIWTPFITNAEMVLNLGSNTVQFAMYGIKWGNSDSLENFTTSSNSTLISIDPGYVLNIQEMIYQNETVDTLTLSPTTVNVTITNIISPPGPPNIQQITDMDWIISHWYYIAIIGGVICLMGALATRNMPILAAGVVLIAAGAIGWYLAGDTSLLSWLSMEPPNLVAWLQRLR